MPPPNLAFVETQHDNYSIYTLATVDHDDRSPLLSPSTPSYGTSNYPHTPSRPSSRKVILNATLKMACIFIFSTLVLGGTLWLALPTLEEADRPLLRIPKSFVQLKDLNVLLKKYRDIYPYRIVVCYVTTYLFLQAFSLPGSMYLSILGGAVWGVARALPLACCCVATGATLCYLISAALGPALLTLPKWKALLDKWASKIQANKENMISFLIVLRIAPLPPHWVVNIVCPHVGIGIVPFWISTALGILGVSVIHTTIGGGLDEMTSADDFHLISWPNFFGLAAIVVGVLIPVGLRYWFRKEVDSVVEAEEEAEEQSALILDEEEVEGDRILAVGPPRLVKKINGQRVLVPDGEYNYESDEDSDDDVILESGPPIPHKEDDDSITTLDAAASSSSSSSR
ncbi:Transmembrane protein 41B [Hypsizygus marmoreus]|uniref:Transmembrane protein 41B n=1 Tax=Hypsizygus marmoreus TaxID=39966 RepID=A0A369KAL5_HYPMA|nr:Transmembrane protein 41B [Hypsizygus marmoreus]